jgi:hypothetical protein
MSLLSIAQAIAVKVGLPKPAAAFSSTDANVQSIIQFVNEAGQELAARYGWQELTKEASFSCPGVLGGITSTNTLVGGSGYASGFTSTYGFVPLTGGSGTGAIATIAVTNGVVTSVNININSQGGGYLVGDTLSASNANLGGVGSGFSIKVATTAIVPTQNQGLISALTGPDFAFVLNETMWDRTTRRPVFGPKAPAEWQQLQAQLLTGPWWQYRIRGGQLLFIPAPAVGDTIYFEWVSNYWCTAGGFTPTQNAFATDTDVGILDERLLTLDALWRYKADKRLAYTEDFDKAEGAIADAMTRNASKPRLNLAGAAGDILPGIFVPAGSWLGH